MSVIAGLGFYAGGNTEEFTVISGEGITVTAAPDVVTAVVQSGVISASATGASIVVEVN